MVDLTPFLPGLSPVQSKAVVARFDGGRLSSEGGLLALREIERRLGLGDRLANCLVDPRAPERVEHRLAEIIRFRMLMIAAGRVWSAHKANVLDLAGLRKRVGFDRRRSYETPDTPMLGLPRSGARHGRCLETYRVGADEGRLGTYQL
jgi:Transposase DDE domain group 1